MPCNFLYNGSILERSDIFCDIRPFLYPLFLQKVTTLFRFCKPEHRVVFLIFGFCEGLYIANTKRWFRGVRGMFNQVVEQDQKGGLIIHI